MLFGAILLTAVTWYPAADWSEKPDSAASPYARRGGTIRLNGAQPPKSFNAYVDNNTYSAMLMDLLYGKLLGRPKGWRMPVKDVLIYPGAGLIVPVAGEIKLMPGTSASPAYRRIDVDVETGKVKGLF